ncbi:MAG: PepSY domain-containing protein [Bacteroidota bacterium]
MKTTRFLHSWLGLLAAFMLFFFAVSGIILNHRSFFSGTDIPRKFLPKTYRYNNWNLASVKSSLTLGEDSVLIYGNIGIWLTDSSFQKYKEFTQGLKTGIDNRKIAKIVKTDKSDIIAGTLSGLYHLKGNKWTEITLPVKEKRITGITALQDNIWVTTRSALIRINKEDKSFITQQVSLPHPVDFKQEVSLFRALWVMHSGKILGTTGKLFVDMLGLVMIFLSITGVIWFVAPDVMRSLKKRPKAKKRFGKVNRIGLKWHNHIGIWTIVFTIFLTLTGMFLRPPLLIPIVRSTFPALPYTILAHPNPWYDKLRDIDFDRQNKTLILSTSDGFYRSDLQFTDSLQPIHPQPPVSVMGINTLEQPSDGEFIIGSFSGIYRWIPQNGKINNYITGQPVQGQTGMSNPFGTLPVAGYVRKNNDDIFLFDYNAGVLSLNRNSEFPAMPDKVRQSAHMSLWNLALEVHTGRILSVVLGDFYILYIPLAGIIILTVLITGTIIWLKRKKRRKCRSGS